MLSRSGTGAAAAELLGRACEIASESESSAQLEVVRELAEDLRLLLAALPPATEGEASPHLLAEGALRCADLANLAACNTPELPEEKRAEGAAAVHLAAGAARALGLLAESGTAALEETPAEYVRRDARSAGWRAALAIRQVEEFLEARSPA